MADLTRCSWCGRLGTLTSLSAGNRCVMEDDCHAARDDLHARARAIGAPLPDEHDREVMLKGIVLSDCVHRFLARRRTQQVIEMDWVLDGDVTRDLIEASKDAYAARCARVETARATAHAASQGEPS